MLKPLALLISLAALGGCSLAPAYQAPPVALPARYSAGPWQPAQPADGLPSQWWQGFADPQLDGLEQRLLAANPTLAAAVAHNDAAQAYAAGLHGSLWPQLGAAGSAVRQRQSDRKPLRGTAQPDEYNTDTIGLNLSFDLDLWGRLRNQVAAGDAQANASADDLAAARLALQAQLAQLYWNAQGLARQGQVVAQALAAYRQALKLTQQRYQGLIASQLDVARAQTQLADAQAQAADLTRQQALARNAIAELVGAPASGFSLGPASASALPQLPASLPSRLLQRRPDIAAAERRVYAANAGIGVARAAFYPDFSLGGLAGGQTAGSGNLLAAGNRIWALGPQFTLPLFDGGARNAAERAARAEFSAASAQYRGRVLKAVREVEDALANLRGWQQQAEDERHAAAAGQQALANSSYAVGTASDLDVVTAQTAALQAQRQLEAARSQGLQASVQLMAALGGGWRQ